MGIREEINDLFHHSKAIYVIAIGNEQGDGRLKSTVPNHVQVVARRLHLFRQQMQGRTTLYRLFYATDIAQLATSPKDNRHDCKSQI